MIFSSAPPQGLWKHPRIIHEHCGTSLIIPTRGSYVSAFGRPPRWLQEHEEGVRMDGAGPGRRRRLVAQAPEVASAAPSTARLLVALQLAGSATAGPSDSQTELGEAGGVVQCL